MTDRVTNTLARGITLIKGEIEDFYKNPDNLRAFEEWRKKKNEQLDGQVLRLDLQGAEH